MAEAVTCPRCGRPAVSIPRVDHAGRVVDRREWGHKCSRESDWHFFRADAAGRPAAVQGRLPGFDAVAG